MLVASAIALWCGVFVFVESAAAQSITCSGNQGPLTDGIGNTCTSTVATGPQGPSNATAAASGPTTPTASSATSHASNNSSATSNASIGSNATAGASSSSTADASAQNGSVAGASAASSSTANASSQDGSAASAQATNSSNAQSAANNDSATAAQASNSSNAQSTANNDSIATTVSDASSTANASAQTDSEAIADASSSSAANSSAQNGSDATADASSSSTASASAQTGSTAGATASGTGTAESTASQGSTATSSVTSNGNAFADAVSGSVATATVTTTNGFACAYANHSSLAAASDTKPPNCAGAGAVVVSSAGSCGSVADSPCAAELQNYFSNANTTGGQAFVNITAPLEGDPTASTPAARAGETCAMIYVFNTEQSLQACCGCPVTADGLLTLNITTQLAGNPVALGKLLQDGIIRIIPTLPNAVPPPATTPPASPPGYIGCDSATGVCCDPTAASTGNQLIPGSKLAAWGDHIQATAITETRFEAAAPTAAELNDGLPEACGAISKLGSGQGACTCPSGS